MSQEVINHNKELNDNEKSVTGDTIVENQEINNGNTGNTDQNLNEKDSEKLINEEGKYSDEDKQTNEKKEKELTPEEKMQIEINKLKEEVENLKDHWQRERAEFINYRKRTAHELLNSKKEAVRNFIHDLLHPLDNLDIVTNVKTESPELKAFVDGVNMVKKDFLSIIDREGVKRMEPLNQPFDPVTMEAISSEESEDYREEIVIEVYQPGYYYQEGESIHSIRPARVKVGKPKINNEVMNQEQK